MTFPIWLVITLGAVCYLVLPFLIWALIKNEKIKKIVTIILFSLYCAVLFVGVFGVINFSKNNVHISFNFTNRWASKNINWGFNITKFDLIINLVMLFPVGMLTYFLLQKRRFLTKILLLIVVGLMTGLLIETCQFILPIYRSVQLTDVLLNTASVLAGGFLAMGYLGLIKKIRK